MPQVRGPGGKFISSEDKPADGKPTADNRSRSFKVYGPTIDVLLEIVEKAYFDKKATGERKKALANILSKLQ